MRKAYTNHRRCCCTNFFQTALRNNFTGYHVQHTTIGARTSKEVDRVGHTNRLQHPGARQHWAAAPILIVRSALTRTLAAFLVDEVWRSHSSYGDAIRRTPINIRMESDAAGGLHAYCIIAVRYCLLKESQGFVSARAMALQNLPQTFRGRERSIRGYASRLLCPNFTYSVSEAVSRALYTVP